MDGGKFVFDRGFFCPSSLLSLQLNRSCVVYVYVIVLPWLKSVFILKVECASKRCPGSILRAFYCANLVCELLG